ncbi:MAG: pantoate--beta-alanine ligase, partial [Candidatus Omnitrophota bacterium]|nr:pantoate--beta-alanine ligase [Candidatus Omnitrophota bacterium]
FCGVATIVTKLFNITMPDMAYFGQKDAQQAIVIKKMARDLNMPVKIKVEPIVREKDGLAMSSRNIFLNKEERSHAQAIYRSLKLAKSLFKKGERDSAGIINKMKQLINEEPDAKIDYIKAVDPRDLKDVKRISGKTLLAIAVKIGNTRLIDNIILN